MANFFTDNDDIRFLFRHMDLGAIAELQEEGFKFAKDFDYAPADGKEAVANPPAVSGRAAETTAKYATPSSS